MCQSASRVRLIRGLSSTSKAEDLWTTRLGTAYRQRFPFSLIVVVLGAVQNSSHLIPSGYVSYPASLTLPRRMVGRYGSDILRLNAGRSIFRSGRLEAPSLWGPRVAVGGLAVAALN